MAQVIVFHVADRLRERRLWNPPEQRGKVIEFPSVEGKFAVPAAMPKETLVKKPS